MDRITRLYSQMTKTHFIGIGVVVLVATAICIGVAVSHHHYGSSGSLSSSFQHYKGILAQIDHAVQWKKYTIDNVSTQDAFVGGNEDNKGPIYVCRAFTGGEVVPGTYSPKDKKCRYSYGGESHERDEFEILTTKDASALIWLRSSNGDIYNGAIIGGKTYSEDDLWIAKVSMYGDYDSIGKIHGRYRNAYVPYGEKEYTSIDYDVLCLKDFAL